MSAAIPGEAGPLLVIVLLRVLVELCKATRVFRESVCA